MNYQEFLIYIKDNLAEYINRFEHINQTDKLEAEDWSAEENVQEDKYGAELHKVIKNNGIVLDGITLRKKGQCISPNIYLNSYFDSYQMGKPMAVIMEEIILRYQKLMEENDIEIADVFDFKAVKNDIVLRLVNYERNREMLKCCPHKKFLDLAITFRYIANRDQLGIASSLISNEEFAEWDIDIEDLYQIALFNTMREFPWHMDSLAKVIVDCIRRRMPAETAQELEEELTVLERTENGVNMFVLSNDSGINGAVSILYDSVIKNFAKVQECNVFILPSSVHEVMLVPETAETGPEFLEGLVQDANQSAVGLIDLLSDHIYYYDKEKDQIYIYGQN